MGGFAVLLGLFIGVPLLELYVLIEVGQSLGALSTVALCILTAFAGSALIRAQGFTTVTRVRGSLDKGELPAVEMIEGAFLLLAGMLLLTPGFITDAIGFACLVPPLRRWLILRFLERNMRPAGPRPSAGPDGGARPQGERRIEVIDGEFRRVDR